MGGLLVVIGLVAGWLSGDDAGEESPPDFSEAGPYTVGVMSIDSGDNLLEVFYPAADDAAGQNLRYETIGTDAGADTIEVDAVVDAEPSTDGPFPVVLHSHGAGSHRLQSARLLAHLASWGLVAAAPDHPERGPETAGDHDRRGRPVDPESAVDTMTATLNLLTELTISRDSPLEGVLDTERVGVQGHGVGGGTAIALGADPQLDVVVGLAPEVPTRPSGASAGSSTVAQAAAETLGDRPVLLIAAPTEPASDRGSETAAFLDALAGDWTLAELANTGPAVFLDTCQEQWNQEDRGAGGAPAGDPLEAGCDPDSDTEPTDRWPVIDHLTVARYLSAFGRDRASATRALDPDFVTRTFPDTLADYRQG